MAGLSGHPRGAVSGQSEAVRLVGDVDAGTSPAMTVLLSFTQRYGVYGGPVFLRASHEQEIRKYREFYG